MQPGNVGALGNLGVVYSRTNRFPAAIDVYRRALKLAPKDPALNTNLGLAYVKQQQFASALPIFTKLASDSNNLQARELLANCQLSLGQNEKALAVLQSLTAAEPAGPGAHYLMGIALTRLKRKEEAHAEFATMMRLVSPAQANFLMGKASYETEYFNEAVDFFRKSLTEDAHLIDAHRELGKAYFSLRDYDNAEKELRQADPQDSDALYYLGACLAESRPDEAILLLKKAEGLAPDVWGPLYYLGRIYVERGQVADALSVLQRAAKLNPDESGIQYQLGRALQKAGRESESKAAFARVKEIKDRALQKEVDAISPNSKK